MINEERCARDVIVIGASTGGVGALQSILPALPADLPALIAVVIHRSPVYDGNLSWLLSHLTSLRVLEPTNNGSLSHQLVLVAPRDHHLILQRSGKAALHRGPKQHGVRPAVDPLFYSAAEAFGERVVGVLLSGGGGDGLSGLIAIKEAGGLAIAQHPVEAGDPSMPRHAIIHDHVDAVLSTAHIPRVLDELARGRPVDPMALSGQR